MSTQPLPPPPPQRWTPKIKRQVVEAVRGGSLTPAAAIVRYDLSAEELASWLSGRVGLRALQYRRGRR